MEVLESITSYVENMKGSMPLCEYHKDTLEKETLEILYAYCNDTEPLMNMNEIDSDFFDKFLIYWLPKNQSRLKASEIYEVLKGVGGYCTYIQRTYNTPNLGGYEVMKVYKKECLRIYQLKGLLLKHLNDPILNTNPLVVDFNAYRHYKTRKATNLKHGVYQQGLFEVMEIDYDNTVVFRRLPRGNCVRVMLTDSLVTYMKKGDILHLRIKQKQFFSFWEIEEIKNCYLSKASQYLKN
ncbi:MAG TPA: hypothetical protein GX707_18630 [Epulopiscium sp.]|nr:hypothetical protein [Candidatus Epulonipiscium sp.]